MAEPSEEALAAAEKFLLAQAFDPCGHNNDLMTEQPAPYEIGSCPMDCETTFLARALDAFAADAEERGRREERKACALLADDMLHDEANRLERGVNLLYGGEAAVRIAHAIRARGGEAGSGRVVDIDKGHIATETLDLTDRPRFDKGGTDV